MLQIRHDLQSSRSTCGWLAGLCQPAYGRAASPLTRVPVRRATGASPARTQMAVSGHLRHPVHTGACLRGWSHFRVGLPGCRPCQRPVRWIHPLDLSVGLSVDRRQPAECLSHTLSPPPGGARQERGILYPLPPPGASKSAPRDGINPPLWEVLEMQGFGTSKQLK